VNKTSEIENSINTLFKRTDKLFQIETDLLEMREKMKKKFKKLKEKDKKYENRMIEIESSINTICDCFPNVKNARINTTSSKKEEMTKLPSYDVGNTFKKEFDDFIDESKRYREINEKEMKDLKTYLSTLKNVDYEEKKNNRERDDKNPLINEINNINVAIKELQSNEKFFINAISGKAGKEDVERNHKNFNQELEKLVKN
jgi:hypothetical protein